MCDKSVHLRWWTYYENFYETKYAVADSVF